MSGILQGLIGSLKSAASSTTDAFFNLVTLLLNTTATDGAQNKTFQDSSTNNFIITTNGNATQGTFTPFSQTGWSNYFDGASYLQNSTSAPLATTASTFTIEAWVYMTAAPTNGASNRVSVIADANPAGSTMYWGFGVNSSQNISFFWYSSGPNNATGNTTVSLNAWHHIAISVSSNAISMYVDGVQQTLSGDTTLTNRGGTTFGDVGVAFELGYWNATAVFTGYMSNVRIVSGTAVYSGSSFTPPTTPLTAISGTSVLTCQSNRFVDNSTNAYPLVTGGTGKLSVQAFSPFLPTTSYDAAVVGGSGYFDGTGDYLTFTDASNTLDMGGAVTSLEGFFYPTSTTSAQCLVAKGGGAGSWSTSNGFEWQLTYSSSKFDFTFNNAGSPANVASVTVPINQWYYVAVATDASNNISLYLNGTRVATSTNAITKPTSRTLMYLGQDVSGSYFTGYMSGVRFIGGSGAYNPTSTTITVPTAPPTAVTNTKLLTNFTNAGIFDSAAKNVLETLGSSQVSTTQAKWGTTSLYCPATNGNYFVSPPNQQNFLFGTGNFTVEAWIYPTAFTNTASGLIGYGLSGGYVDWNLEISTAGAVLYIDNDGGRFTSSSNLSANVWTHIAIARTNTAVTMYFNGVSVGTYSTINNISGSSTSARLYVGTGAQVPGSRQFVGYIDDPRITKGYARYTANFTPPTAAFPTL